MKRAIGFLAMLGAPVCFAGGVIVSRSGDVETAFLLVMLAMLCACIAFVCLIGDMIRFVGKMLAQGMMSNVPKEKIRFCDHCGGKLADGAAFCSHCGHKNEK